jgi:membrane-associated phospholipid phosphatase
VHSRESGIPLPSVRVRWLVIAGVALVAFSVLTVYVAGRPVPGAVDLVTYARLAEIRSPGVTSALEVVTALGSVPVVIVAALAAATGLWLRTARVCYPVVMLATVGVTAGCVFLLKVVVGRGRPPVGSLIGAPALDFSFPSGHTTDGTVVYVLCATLFAMVVRRRVVQVAGLALALLLALGIGCSRVYLGYHWATDVLGGWLLACSLVTAAIFATYGWRAWLGDIPRPTPEVSAARFPANQSRSMEEPPPDRQPAESGSGSSTSRRRSR